MMISGDFMNSNQTNRGAAPIKAIKANLKRATYYLRPEQIKSLKIKAVHMERPVSELLREAIDLYLSQNPARRPANQRLNEFLSVD
ncbi:MAG: hypothetical protein VYA34_17295 [Myxococcota bacterium]|nr:hypothetical protein [Myxococcota bacterium]